MTHRPAFLALALSFLSSQAVAECRQALAIALDVSGSVDLREYRLQIDGLVTALSDPDIVNILLAMPSAPVSLMVYEWSGPEDQRVLLPWTPISNRQVLDGARAALAQVERRVTAPGTALGVAMNLGVQFLAVQSPCWKRTLDISGDGKSNFGPRPRDVKNSVTRAGITVNALVIGSHVSMPENDLPSQVSELSSYFRAEVIVGPDSFVQTASGYEDYAEAMTLKLKRELEGLVVGSLQ